MSVRHYNLPIILHVFIFHVMNYFYKIVAIFELGICNNTCDIIMLSLLKYLNVINTCFVRYREGCPRPIDGENIQVGTI